MSDGRHKAIWFRLASASVSGSLSALILVPFFSGRFPPLMTSIFVAWTGFVLAGVAIGTPFRRGVFLGTVAAISFPIVLTIVDSLGLWRGYTEPKPLFQESIQDNPTPDC